MSAPLNLDGAMRDTASQLGQQIGMLTLEINAQIAARSAVEKKLAETERKLTELKAEKSQPATPADT